MTERGDGEQQKAELLWKYIEELKQAENPADVQFVAVTTGECAEVVGVMETAAEAYVLARADSAPHCRRESARRRLQAAIDAASPGTDRADASSALASSPRSPAPASRWRSLALPSRAAGVALAIAALAVIAWLLFPRAQPAGLVDHEQAVALMPALLAGTLDDAKARAVWEHMGHCEECRRLYREKWERANPKRHLPVQSRLLPGPSFVVTITAAMPGDSRSISVARTP